MLTAILIGVAVIVAIVLILAMLQPGEFRVSRTATMPASVAAVFPHVNNLRNWEAWSPWARLDPNAKSTFEGPEAGNGASMAWSGNNQVGEGRMTITESRPDEMVRFRLEFHKPMKATNSALFSFRPEGKETLVTWTMSGTNNFMGKLFSVFINCEKMVGRQFEQGLANMRAVVEGTCKG